MLAGKNRKSVKRGLAQSGGRNEKPRTDRRLAGSCVQSETGFANVIGGEADRHNEIRQHPTKPARTLAEWALH